MDKFLECGKFFMQKNSGYNVEFLQKNESDVCLCSKRAVERHRYAKTQKGITRKAN